MRGGARARSGPPPDPYSLRGLQRRERGEVLASGWIVLPVTGRHGDPPEWPLPGQSDREAVLWARLWTKPQATQWERLGVELDVALYVRRLAEAERPDATAALGNLVARLAEGLGLTAQGMRSLRWQLGVEAPQRVAEPVEGDDVRDRLGGSVTPIRARDRFTRTDEGKIQ